MHILNIDIKTAQMAQINTLLHNIPLQKMISRF